MKILQRLCLCSSYLMIGDGFHLTASELIGRPVQRMCYHAALSNTLISSVPGQHGSLLDQKRFCTLDNDNQNFRPKTLSSSSALEPSKENVENIVAKCRDLFGQVARLWQEIQNDWNKDKQQYNNPVKRSTESLNRILTKSNPLNTQDLSFLSNSNSPSELKKTSSNMGRERTSINLIDKKNTLFSEQDIPKTMCDMQLNFVNRVIAKAHYPKKINMHDLHTIINLYKDLVHRPIDGITNVLENKIDTGKSGIYCNVIRHAQSNGADIEMYRQTYRRLMEAFGPDGMNIVYSTAKEIINEKESMRNVLNTKKITDLAKQDYTTLMAAAWYHPLYPVQADELKQIIDLYASLAHRPKKGITQVLENKINTGKSAIYNEIIKYVESRQSSLKVYRDLYERIKKSLRVDGMRIIHSMIDKNLVTALDQEITSSLFQASDLDQSEQSASVVHETDSDYDGTPLLDEKNSDAINFTVTNTPDTVLQTPDGKYSISQKERNRLNRLYGLLPQYDSRSITWVLLGSKTNTKILNEVMLAIDIIKKEAQQEGDTTLIDLGYFQRLHCSSVRVTGKGGEKEKALGKVNGVEDMDKNLNISNKEKKLLTIRESERKNKKGVPLSKETALSKRTALSKGTALSKLPKKAKYKFL